MSGGAPCRFKGVPGSISGLKPRKSGPKILAFITPFATDLYIKDPGVHQRLRRERAAILRKLASRQHPTPRPCRRPCHRRRRRLFRAAFPRCVRLKKGGKNQNYRAGFPGFWPGDRPRDPLRSTGCTPDVNLHQKSAPETNSKAIS